MVLPTVRPSVGLVKGNFRKVTVPVIRRSCGPWLPMTDAIGGMKVEFIYHPSLHSVFRCIHFSSPEPKAHKVSL